MSDRDIRPKAKVAPIENPAEEREAGQLAFGDGPEGETPQGKVVAVPADTSSRRGRRGRSIEHAEDRATAPAVAAEPAAAGRGAEVGTVSGNRPKHIPAAPQFTPEQVNHDLGRLLAIVAAHEGDREALLEAVRREYHSNKAGGKASNDARLKEQRKLAGNTLSSMYMDNYGLLIREDMELSDLGRELLALPSEELRLKRFAQHILQRLGGMDLLLAVRRIQERGERVGQEVLADELRSVGIELSTEATHHGAMGQWLREAGVLQSSGGGWDVDDDLVEELTGTSLRTIDEWTGLTAPQQKFLQTVRRHAESAGSDPVWAKALMQLAESEHGRVFPPRQKAAKIYDPLVDAGWVMLSHAESRGKSGKIAPTKKLLDTDVEALTGFLTGEIPADLRAKLNTPMPEIYRDLEVDDTYTKGIALELLAMRLASDLGLTPVRFRQRGVVNGGELDLVAEAAHLHFTRWLFQCKNTPHGRVGIEQLAREVGMSTLLRAHVVVIVTTGGFTLSVHEYADELRRNTPLQVVLVDSDVLKRYRSRGRAAITDHFWTTARETLRSKRPQVDIVLDRIAPPS